MKEILPEIFPEVVKNLPKADIRLEGLRAYLSQGESYQIIFMEFEKDAEVAEHSHESQWGIVLEGRIKLCIEGKTSIFEKGDRYFIPKGVTHSAKIYAGYADMTFFNQKDRYAIKEK